MGTEGSALEDSERSRELAGWLVEAGKRRRLARPAPAPNSVLEDPSGTPRQSRLPRVLLFAVLAAACMQYLYLDAQLEIVSLRELIVFVGRG